MACRSLKNSVVYGVKIVPYKKNIFLFHIGFFMHTLHWKASNQRGVEKYQSTKSTRNVNVSKMLKN